MEDYTKYPFPPLPEHDQITMKKIIETMEEMQKEIRYLANVLESLNKKGFKITKTTHNDLSAIINTEENK
jgi:hypothetical protein